MKTGSESATAPHTSQKVAWRGKGAKSQLPSGARSAHTRSRLPATTTATPRLRAWATPSTRWAA